MQLKIGACDEPGELVAREPTSQLHSVRALRGLAALAVVFFHLGLNNRVKFPAMVPAITAYGRFGVQAFFVLSGFILPWSMLRSGYQLRDLNVFLVKRLMRVEPAYLFSIGVSLLFLELASHGGGEPFRFSMTQVIAHLGYVNVFFSTPWVNPVYWTLAVEVQFYLVIALCQPIINHRFRFAFFAFFALLSLVVPSPQFLPHHISLFLLGIGIYLCRSSIGDRRMAIAWTVAAIALMYFQLTPGEVGGGLIGACFLIPNNVRSRLLEGLGAISYSLYLVHYHVGNKMQSVVRAHLPWYATFACGVIASLIAAYVVYRCIELPTQRWASARKYRDPSRRRVQARNVSRGTTEDLEFEPQFA